MKRPLLLLLALACGPKKAPEVAAAPPPVVDPEAWRATQPGPGPEKAWTAPAVQTTKLSNGIPVYFVPNTGLPLVTVQLSVEMPTGAPGKAGIGNLMGALLDEGTKKYDTLGLAAAAQGLGAELSTTASSRSVGVSLNALGGAAEGPSLDLLAEVALNPAFKETDFKRVQAEIISDVEADRSDPRTIARETMDVQLYGNGHPYSLPRRGSLTTLPKLKLADVKGWYTKWWHAGNASFVVTGAVDPAAFTRELDARFGKWKVGKDKPPVVAAALAVPSTKLVFVESPGSVQSFILTGAAGLQKTDAGWYAADMAGTLAAGNFSSPLNMVLREEKGWSYGAYGGFDATKDLGWFQSYASVQADKTAPAVAEFVGVYSRAMANPPSAELLQVTKDGMVKSLPGGFETNARAAGSLSRLVADGLPTDTWQTWGAKVNAVTAEEAHAAAKKWLDPAHQIIVVVGPRTVTGKDANGTELNVDVFSELKGLGYAFVDATPAKAGGSSKGDKKKGE